MNEPNKEQLWMCPACNHVMTEEQSKGYLRCPSGVHFVQHIPCPPGMNHYCPGESGTGEWSCRSQVPSICFYCKTPNYEMQRPVPTPTPCCGCAGLRAALRKHVEWFGGADHHPDDCAMLESGGCDECRVNKQVESALASQPPCSGGNHSVRECLDMLRDMEADRDQWQVQCDKARIDRDIFKKQRDQWQARAATVKAERDSFKTTWFHACKDLEKAGSAQGWIPLDPALGGRAPTAEDADEFGHVRVKYDGSMGFRHWSNVATSNATHHWHALPKFTQ